MKNITVLVSGSGSNLQRIIDCIDNGEIPNTKVNLVVADRDCYALERAENHQIPNQLRKTFARKYRFDCISWFSINFEQKFLRKIQRKNHQYSSSIIAKIRWKRNVGTSRSQRSD